VVRRHLALEEVNANSAAPSRTADLKITVVISDARDPEPGKRLDVAYKSAVGRRDHHVLHFVIE